MLRKASGAAGCGSTGGRYRILADVGAMEQHCFSLRKVSHVSALGAFYLASRWQLGLWQSCLPVAGAGGSVGTSSGLSFSANL